MPYLLLALLADIGNEHCGWEQPIPSVKKSRVKRLIIYLGISKKEGNASNAQDKLNVGKFPAKPEKFGKGRKSLLLGRSHNCRGPQDP